MAQYDFGTINPATTTGSDLAALLQNWRDAVLSNHTGTSRPAYIKSGQIWVNTTTAANWVINLYDGAADIPLGYVNTSDDAAGFLTRSIVTTKTASASILVGERDMLVGIVASTANIVLTLPITTTAKNGFKIRFQKRDNTAFTVTISRAGSDLINGSASYVLAQQYDMVEMVSDGVSSWYAYGGIVDGTITTAKLADSIVTTAKLANNAVTTAKLTPAVTNYLVPAGAIMPFAGLSAPLGWLLCAGQAVSQTTFADLYNALGGVASPWGQDNVANTFNLPDFRGRVPAGLDNMGGISANRLRSTRTIAITSISQSLTTATVTTAVAHGLDVGDSVTITGAGNTAFNGTWTVANVNRIGSEAVRASLTFTFTLATSATIAAAAGGTITTAMAGGVSGSILGATGGLDTHTLTEGQLAPHDHSVYYNRDSPSGGSGDTADHSHNATAGSGPYNTTVSGGGGPHNNVQPTIVVNYIIKT